MKQEDKILLLKDLCARLPYGVKVQVYSYEHDVETIETLYGIDSDGYMSTLECDTLNYISKPYLFPLSSMTRKQKVALTNLTCETSSIFETAVIEIEFYNKHHIDYRGLIPKGLANDATNLNIYG